MISKVANTKLPTQKENEEENIEKPIQNIPYREDLLQNLWKDFDKEVQQHQQPSNPTASAIVEVDIYLEEIILLRKDSFSISQAPLLWWHQRKHIYPKIIPNYEDYALYYGYICRVKGYFLRPDR
ncbi:unnamed protein product [Diabrotica balteata]|uniref:Uncharacterized protein n=1 Tax=Diabrotica balteata TaxID=107213 RepID=A0A9N9SUR2_DIABA|nr:unnamed protein product [Diabrotica balteata]